MVSPRRIAANQANARHSTGPCSAAGKSRSRANALKHGLTIPAALLPDIAHLARTIAGPAADDPAVYQAALRVAEAAIEVIRARESRVALMGRIAHNPTLLNPPASAEPIPGRPARFRFSKADFIRAHRNRTYQELRAALVQIVQEFKTDAEIACMKEQRTEAQHNATPRASTWDQLGKLDRYLRRVA